jgi:hypothetical protein
VFTINSLKNQKVFVFQKKYSIFVVKNKEFNQKRQTAIPPTTEVVGFLADLS